MAKQAKVWTGSEWADLASATTDLTPYSTTAQMNTAIAASAGLTLINTTTFSAASTASINNCFTSSYENYKIVATITSSATSITNLAYRLRVSGTDTTSGNYDYGLLYITNAGGPTRVWSAAQTSGIIGYIGNVSGVLSFDIAKPQLATETVISAIGNEQDNSGFSGYSSWQRMSMATAYDGITFIPASGTFTGTIRVYGYKNS